MRLTERLTSSPETCCVHRKCKKQYVESHPFAEAEKTGANFCEEMGTRAGSFRMACFMHIDYEVSEKDFLQAQDLAMKKSPLWLMRWARLLFPLAGAAAVTFLAVAIARDGFKVKMIGGALIAFWLVSTPIWLRSTLKRAYKKARHFHGPMSLDADDNGMRITGNGIDSRMAWSNLANFYEDEHSFVIYQSSATFHPIPKRMIPAEQITELRECFRKNIGKG